MRVMRAAVSQIRAAKRAHTFMHLHVSLALIIILIIGTGFVRVCVLVVMRVRAGVSVCACVIDSVGISAWVGFWPVARMELTFRHRTGAAIH